MAKEQLNPKESFRSPPRDRVRIEFIEKLKKDPVKTLEQAYIDEQVHARDIPVIELLLLARILEKIH